jgi:hypothetical protein
MPVEAIRQELERIVNSSPLWDRRVARLEVTNTAELSFELRALVSATNSSDLWSLRCYVREALIGFMRTIGNESFPSDAGGSASDEFSVEK